MNEKTEKFLQSLVQQIEKTDEIDSESSFTEIKKMNSLVNNIYDQLIDFLKENN